MTFFSNPKRRDYVLNPRGKALYDDSNRFGTKMLEKMGWSKGKGLGANLDGQLDFIKVSHKGDQKGVGFKDRDDQWTSHESNFNSLLNSFKSAANSDEESQDFVVQGFKDSDKVQNNENTDKKADLFSGVSLEEQSKKSRARVHYKKFTRGKDLARYSEKDLANIFGKKSLDCNASAADGSTGESNDEETEKLSEKTPNFGITTVETGTTINEYFKSKMKKLNSNGLDKASDETCDAENSLNNKKEKKKRKKVKADESESQVPDIVDKNLENNKEKVTEEQVEHNQLSETSKRKHEGDSIEDEPRSRKKKNKEAKKQDIETTNDVSDKEADNENPSTSKKSKKSSKRKDCDAIDINDVGNVQSTLEKEVSKSKKSKKDKKFKTIDTSVDQCSTNLFDYIANSEMNENSLDPVDVITDNIYEIRRYRAEIFRFVDLHGFPGSTLSDIPGYGYTSGMTLKITEKTNENHLISTMWNEALDKYANYNTKKKKKFVEHIGALKKKSIFKI